MKIQNQVSIADSVAVVPYIFHLYRFFSERRKFGGKKKVFKVRKKEEKSLCKKGNK